MKTTSKYDKQEKKLLEKHCIKLNTCSLCGKEYCGLGHNAEPLRKLRCCDQCNILVILARLRKIEAEK